ncbi:DUF4386 domain-containing protein [Aquibium sp. A9E412]|uniref:DUF4386 domain-containing protein n=1 Tax=Aquibium sp. A9E412 TaxID=2976767 RepID=UPI0025AF12FB|nr:DUF4386 domain-containing protein [Aquibium sp. A9E412]MDN2568405.1 DUF4386 domain-containing protein [Aquibium sp. A9E412]
MTDQPHASDATRRMQARAAGAFYLTIIVMGVFAELAVRAQLVVPGDAAATAAAVRAAPGLLRAGFAADVVMAVSDVALAVLLYRLLKPVGPALALAAMAFRLVQAAVIAAGLMNQQIALALLQAGDAPSAADRALALVFFEAHAQAYDLALVFFGVNCVLTGLLVWRAPFLPRLLGLAVLLAGPVYLAGSALRFLAPQALAAFAPAYAVPLFAETAFALWLLVAGTGRPRPGAAAARPA